MTGPDSSLDEQLIGDRFNADDEGQGAPDERKSLAALLTDLVLEIEVLGRVLPVDASDAASQLGRVRTIAGRALEIVPSQSETVVDTKQARPDLVHVLRHALHTLHEETSIHTELTVGGVPRPLEGAAVKTLLDITRQVLVRVAGHASTQRVRIDVDFSSSACILCIMSDGESLGTLEERGGDGVGWIRAQVQRVPARVAVHTEPGRGSAICLVVGNP